jgi:uncharacterized ion transporter superfamily protein YfcC
VTTEASVEMTEAPAPKKRRFQFPSSLTILGIITVLVWILAFFIPAGQYKLNAEGEPIPGPFHNVPAPEGFRQRVFDLFLSPVNGLYGLQNPEGHIGPFNSGVLHGAAGVFLFILAIGAFMIMIEATGALDVAISQLARALQKRGWLLVAAIMVVFSLLATTMGFSVETFGFYPLLIPLMLALGYDRIATTGMILFSVYAGFMASTINPFTVGVASGIANTAIGDGLPLRAALWVVLTGLAILYVLWYGRRVRARPSRSLVGFEPVEGEEAGGGEVGGGDPGTGQRTAPKVLSRRQVAVLAIMGLTFVLMIVAVIPWASIIGAEHEVTDPISGQTIPPNFWFELGWWFPELTALFIVSAIVIGIVGGLGEKRISSLMVSGAADFLGPAVLVVLAQGGTVILNNTQTIDTILHAMEVLVHGTSTGVATFLIYIVTFVFGFVVSSGSGNASLVMPLLAPLADLARLSRPLVVTIWSMGFGLSSYITPTSAVIMGGVALAKVGYDKYVRFVIPLMGILFVVSLIVLIIAASVG